MIILIALVIGALAGWMQARAGGGNVKDRAWQAAVFALIFALLAVFAAVLIGRLSGR